MDLCDLKVLYVYSSLPNSYQRYMGEFLEEVKGKIGAKSLSYNILDEADYVINSYGIRDRVQRLFFKSRLTNIPSYDIKIMKQFDIIHLQRSFLFPKFDVFYRRNSFMPKLVVTLRGADVYVKPWLDKRWRDFYKTKSKFIDAFITMSIDQKQYLQRWGVKEDKVYVIPPSIQVDSMSKAKYPSADAIKIISAYRMCWEKNIAGNLQVVKSLKDYGVPVHYHVYGDGPDKGQLLYLIDVYGLQDVVTFFGEVDNKILRERMVEYDVFLQLSHLDSFGVSVIEAQSVGVPAIVSDGSGIRETIVNGKTGFVLNPFDIEPAMDAILKLWNNSEMYYSFSERAIENVRRRFSVEREIDELLALYRTLL